MTGSGDVSDRLAIRALVDAYAIAIDEAEEDRYLSMFVDDGVLLAYLGDAASAVEPVAEFRGADALRTLATVTRGSCIETFHLVGNHVAEIDGDAATADTYCVGHHLMETDGAPVDEVLVVHYKDDLVRTADGWRFKVRRAYRLWSEERQAVTRPLEVDRKLAAAMSRPASEAGSTP